MEVTIALLQGSYTIEIRNDFEQTETENMRCQHVGYC